jgi:glutamine synthetase
MTPDSLGVPPLIRATHPASRAGILVELVKECRINDGYVAEQHGLLATFMPKPFGNLTGNGAHVHLSLADANNGKNLFLDSSAELGLSQLGRWFMGGVLRHARALSALVAPLVNSYKRLICGAPRSGATWAPVYITYGASNRTQMIRVVDGRPTLILLSPGFSPPVLKESRRRLIRDQSTTTTCTTCPKKRSWRAC